MSKRPSSYYKLRTSIDDGVIHDVDLSYMADYLDENFDVFRNTKIVFMMIVHPPIKKSRGMFNFQIGIRPDNKYSLWDLTVCIRKMHDNNSAHSFSDDTRLFREIWSDIAETYYIEKAKLEPKKTV